MKKTHLAGISALALLLATNLTALCHAQEAEEYQNHPGYFDLRSIPAMGKPKETVEISLTPGLVRLFGADDSGFENILSALKVIKIYTFNALQGDRSRWTQKIDDFSRKLLAEKWERFLRIDAEKEHTEIFTRTQGRDIQGMVILSLDSTEASFINIVGKLDVGALGKLSRRFDLHVDSLDTK